jgi:4-hydroxybenzoate polyprenyltransferase
VTLLDLARLARPQQWVKNSFVLVGLIFGHGWSDPVLVRAALLATVAFCLASSAVYAFNDATDAENDRRHPKKRFRPVADRRVGAIAAYVLACILGATGMAIADIAARPVLWAVAAYLCLNLAYTIALKQVPVVDVFCIAAGFMLRLFAGTTAIGIEASSWLLACGFFLTLFLGFAKRKAEVELLEAGAAGHRAALSRYPSGFLDAAVMISSACMVVAYASYSVSETTALMHGTSRLVWTLPWVLLGTFRYLLRLKAGLAGADPSMDLYRDPVLAACAIGWILTTWLLIGPTFGS